MAEKFDAPFQLKICSFCGFIGIQSKFKQSGSICKLCDRVRYSKWYLSTKSERQRLNRQWRLSRYNLTLEQFQELLTKQNNRCKICGLEFNWNVKDTKPHIDHDHSCCPKQQESCGKCVRALLCGYCNKGLGVFRDNINLLERAISYLKDYEYTRKFPRESSVTISPITRMGLQNSNTT